MVVYVITQKEKPDEDVSQTIEDVILFLVSLVISLDQGNREKSNRVTA